MVVTEERIHCYKWLSQQVVATGLDKSGSEWYEHLLDQSSLLISEEGTL